MSTYIETAEPEVLPIIVLQGIVAFPRTPMNIELISNVDRQACSLAEKNKGKIFLVTAKNAPKNRIGADDLHQVGVIAHLKQIVKASHDKHMRAFFECESRAVMTKFIPSIVPRAEVISKEMILLNSESIENTALIRQMQDKIEQTSEFIPKLSPDALEIVKIIDDAGLLSDFIAANILRRIDDKQKALSEFDPVKRAHLVLAMLEQELEILKAESEINQKVKSQIDKNNRDYFLREQMRVIEEELGVDEDEEIAEYNNAIKKLDVSDEIKEKLFKDVKKLAKSPFSSAESAVLRNYLDTVIEIPWGLKTTDRTDIEAGRKILDKDHYGLDKVKTRILEFLAVRKLNPDIKNQIICLVGAPGVGKTSIAASLAEAMNRKYVRVSLGGVRDEAEIRGHRKTYVASMPGRIVNAIMQAKVINPLILLDEIDKIGSDGRSDPSCAMLEVLDPEQNKAFRDNFLEIPIDLSDCVFICTANTLDTIPRPLLDRMEIIKLDSYTRNEKLNIAKKHLVPKQRKRCGLTAKTFKIADSAILEIIDSYTMEAGVRRLERAISSIARKCAMKIASGDAKSVSVTVSNLKDLISDHKISPEKIFETDQIGVVNGLAYTEAGGDLLKIECSALEGSGKIELTGSLGDVMKESASAAVSYVRSIADKLNIDTDFYKTKDIHIHVPDGATPKDGPSAGITIMTALVSELSQIPVKRDVAMTGEITLRGRVMPIGGLREKTAAAHSAGVKTVLIPFDNEDDLKNIDPEVREALTFVPCKTAAEVLHYALATADTKTVGAFDTGVRI